MAKDMKEEVVDTNVLIRFFVGDNKVQQKRARNWFSQAQKGKRKLAIKTIVVAETCFVLESFYKGSIAVLAAMLASDIGIDDVV